MSKIKSILLVDDDEITNFINQDIIEGMQITDHIQVCEDGKIAMDYLEKAYAGVEGYVKPDLIFLDLNMPVMNGFEFLKAYQSTFPENDRCKLVIMLTTSLRDQDVDQAIDLKLVVTDYMEKPLSTEKVASIMKQYFDFYFETSA
jgi:CheY-like chemotaxis protein